MSPVIQSSSPVKWSSPVNRDCRTEQVGEQAEESTHEDEKDSAEGKE